MLKRYALRHKGNKNAMIEKIAAPPRLSVWTEEIHDAYLFELEKEAQDCADYITKTAFNVEAFPVEVDENDHRIIAEQHRWQKASDIIHDKYGIERTKVRIVE